MVLEVNNRREPSVHTNNNNEPPPPQQEQQQRCSDRYDSSESSDRWVFRGLLSLSLDYGAKMDSPWINYN